MRPCSLRPYLPTSALRRRAPGKRSYAVQAPGAPTLEIFNQHVKYLQKERAASNAEQSRKVDYIRDEVAQRLCERLLDIQRHFPSVLDLGANSLNIARALANPDHLTISSHPSSAPDAPSAPDVTDPSKLLTSRISHLTCAETSPTLLHRDPEPQSSIPLELQLLNSLETLPYEPNTFDAVLSSLSIHWVNDLPSLLAQINSILKPDAPFLAAMMGGDSVFELRTSLQLADLERRGGVSPHVSPMADVRDVGGLLSKAGFKLLTVDVDDMVVEYPDTFALMMDLQAMGESNAILKSAGGLGGLSRDVLLANESIYRQLYGEEANEGLPATFRIIYMIAWKEGAGQGKPLPRGSGQLDLKDVLGGGDFKVS
ncbi:hypothetical protein EPUS_04961 [Endocarpon pusillum Z07020]|uniref:Methyltransferase type 11 domain-containing protein n=1 Tax=Endocarpon pusillum (strain Z07020 / HMAS-L-300199) TaxID=1263415 RepID=U1GIS9_ENDPU|nr:uncharacterized protein EPUS_04961 [Endocarpon pusillum Z07020]ERF72043.1 hypothetical protein EPUS_04961 [Endocarpon pusillum Z07020]